MFTAGHIPWCKGLTKETDNRLVTMSTRLKGVKPSDKCIEAVKQSNSNRIWKESSKDKIRAKLKGNTWNKGKRRPQSYVDWISKYMREHNPMSVPEYKEKAIRHLFASLRNKQNKSEKYLESLLQEILPNQFRYNGCLELGIMIGSIVPDFVNVDGRKQLIELFGDYWHRGENPEDRTSLYKEAGWDYLIIWEHELADETNLIAKLREFSRKGEPG